METILKRDNIDYLKVSWENTIIYEAKTCNMYYSNHFILNDSIRIEVV
jgi:hypothetical protein